MPGAVGFDGANLFDHHNLMRLPQIKNTEENAKKLDLLE